jgi:hypothetical protein
MVFIYVHSVISLRCEPTRCEPTLCFKKLTFAHLFDPIIPLLRFQ